MFEKIITFSVHNKFIIALATLALIAGGLYSLSQIPINAVPDITNNQVQVVTATPSLTAEEVERLITYPLEISMANIPGVLELRSISRYGLSVVTIVFEEDVSTTDARQYVSEQISLASQEIPAGLGQPELMPITTGLGEIYQYTLEVAPGYEDQYDAMELRTIHDWIVKRQLSGIPGIVEVSSFGGFLKQYQISLDPARMRSFGLTVQDVLQALEANNQNTGGSYLERGTSAYYIRAEGLVSSPEEIGAIVVKGGEGSAAGATPLLLRQVATIEEGYPPRYGAMTKNGQGETVGGITLMLKGANSSKTLDRVHQRVAEVQASLPEGLRIEPYLDRSELVSRTTGTIKTNLLEGGLIVIFVLVLLLGNLRAGFIVASVIPLSLLFAFIMMHLFGVSANLMSLGALDFGIVIDGAVIIVEGVLHALFAYHAGQHLSQPEMDRVVARSAASIYKSAAFGVLIIIVVFIPIMTLTGIEGKMFRPMAQTVSFAVLGALLLSLTYVPMLAALLLKKKVVAKKNVSDRIVGAMQAAYQPSLRWAMHHRALTLSLAVGLLLVSLLVFSRMGGVFIPNLEEGDIAMQMTLPPGSSLEESIRTSTQAEQILLNNFPEVKQVVSKIGTAEVPTDPMSVELADIMVVLKDKKEWTSAESREVLVSLMEEKLSAIIGASFDFTQPIQLRFNELMTGAKTDVAVKIYGEDMGLLQQKASEAAALVAPIAGAADIQIEQTEGLPQLLVRYNRQQIARHGVSIEELNTIIRTAFAGEQAGVVFEGERKFDMVVRLGEADRRAFDLHQLFVRNQSGQLIPLSELTQVQEVTGPAQISRDDTRRRVTLGINVRERDIESLVEEVQQKLQQLELPPGYYITYGGDFENLQQAKRRLQIAVPVALAMILVLLYFAFGSFRYALLIFMAVPLSAIGGVFALWVRDLPFSISAGVGFIALFGVAVLNGIVLISYFNELKEEGNLSLDEVVIKGGLVRLRPVIMTASVAALGFLPMALSNTAGAEVQRPLATVVIGGLISATLLTLVVLPVLYLLVEEWSARTQIRKGVIATGIIGLMLMGSLPASAQQPTDTLRLSQAEAEALALQNHPEIKIAELEIQKQQRQQKGSIDLPGTSVGLQYGQINSYARDAFWEVNQSLGSLPAQVQRGRLNRQRTALASQQKQLSERELTYQLRSAWQQWLYLRQVRAVLQQQLGLYQEFEKRISLQLQVGESSLLESTLAQNSLLELQNSLLMRQEELSQAEMELQLLLVTDQPLAPASDTLLALEAPSPALQAPHPRLNLLEGQLRSRQLEAGLERAQLFPEISVGYFRHNLTEADLRYEHLQGVQLEMSLPLWFLPRQAAIQRAHLEQEQAREQLALARQQLRTTRRQQASELAKYQRLLTYYQQQGLPQAELLQRVAGQQLAAGEIDFFQYLLSMQQATQTYLQYLESLHAHNQTVLHLYHLSE